MFIFHKTKKNQALSLILTLLVVSSILTGTVLVGDIIIRHNQVVEGAEISEKAYFAAESAMEKALYEILQNYVNALTYTLDEDLDDGANCLINAGDIAVDDDCPNPDEVECSNGNITLDNPWVVSLSANQSFQLDLDIDGATYPTSLTIYKAGDEPSDLLVYECTPAGTPRTCSTNLIQTFKVGFPYSFSLSDSKFYQIRINNLGDSSESYTLTPGGENTLPIGLEITTTGVYSGYERKLVNNFPKWQKFGTD